MFLRVSLPIALYCWILKSSIILSSPFVSYDLKYLYNNSLGSINTSTIQNFRSSRLTGVLPATISQINLLIVTVKSLMLFNQNLESLFEYFWIVVPNKDIHKVHSILMVATNSKLHPIFRIVGESAVLYEKKHRRYHGWHIQQDIKLAMSRFVRTAYYIIFDADVFCGRKMAYDDFIDSKTNRAYTISERAKTFYAYTIGNFNLTGQHLNIPFPDVNDETLMMGFTPIIFSTAVVNNITSYFTARERRPWLEYFMELHMSNKLFTEYLLYWMWSVNNGVYDLYHINVPSHQIAWGCEATAESLAAYFNLKNRPPLLHSDDNKVNDTANIWMIFKNGMKIGGHSQDSGLLKVQ